MMKISQETCLFVLMHQFLRRIGGVIAHQCVYFLWKINVFSWCIITAFFIRLFFYAQERRRESVVNGTMSYYVERFKTSIMNRLVENEASTLLEQYNVCKHEI